MGQTVHALQPAQLRPGLLQHWPALREVDLTLLAQQPVRAQPRPAVCLRRVGC